MFGLFHSAPFEDPALGTLTRSGGRWKGTISFGPHRDVVLRLVGDRKAPNPAALALAHALPARFADLRASIEDALFEHLEPYREAGQPGELLPIERATDLWPHVAPEHVLIEPLAGSPDRGPILELGYRVAWDEEHTVAARIQGWRLFELCGSV